MRCQDNIYGSEDTRELLNPTFRDTGAGTRANINSGENISDGGLNDPTTNPSILGKIKRWFTDLENRVFTKIGNPTAADPENPSLTIPGIATLDAQGHVPASQLPSYVDDVLEGYLGPKDSTTHTFLNFYKTKTVSGYTLITSPPAGANPKENWWYEYDGSVYFRTADTVVMSGKNYYEENATYSEVYTPETGKIYVDFPTNTTFRWAGSAYAPIGSDLALGETSGTAYRGDRGKTAYDHSQITSTTADRTTNPHKVQANAVGTLQADGTMANTLNKAVMGMTFNSSNGKVTLTYQDGTTSSAIQVYASPLAFIHFGTTAPSDPAAKPIWIDTGNGYILKVHDGTQWIAPRSVWG